jgi:EmrB/QacA subfamily drug resistance transporter
MGTKARQRWVLGLASVASLMVALDMLVVTTALNTIRVKLGASIEQLEWTVSAYTLSLAVLMITASALGDRYGRRRLFVVGLAVFTVASAACALAPGMGWLIAARALQGAGSAAVMPHAMALVSTAYPAERRARALGIFSSVTGLAILGGPMVGGAVVQGLDWQWIFWLNVPIGLVVIPLVLSRIEETGAGARRFDPVGLLLGSAAALGVVWALVRGNAAGWTSPQVLVPLVAGLLLAVGFVRWELRVREPMMPMRYFRSRAFAAGNTAGFLLYGSVFAAAFFFTQFFQAVLGYGPLDTGLRLAPWTVTLFVVSPIAGALINRVGDRPLIVAGMLANAAGYGWIALIAEPGLGYPALVPPLVLAGVGISMAMPAAQNCVVGAVPRAAVGQASGAFNTLRQLGGTFGLTTAAAVFAATGGYVSPRAFTDGFGPALGVAVGLSVVAAAAGLLLPGRRPAAATPVPEPTPVLAGDR